MFRALPFRLLSTATAILLCVTGSISTHGVTSEAPSLTDEQVSLMDFARHRFATQGLTLRPRRDQSFGLFARGQCGRAAWLLIGLLIENTATSPRGPTNENGTA